MALLTEKALVNYEEQEGLYTQFAALRNLD